MSTNPRSLEAGEYGRVSMHPVEIEVVAVDGAVAALLVERTSRMHAEIRGQPISRPFIRTHISTCMRFISSTHLNLSTGV